MKRSSLARGYKSNKKYGGHLGGVKLRGAKLEGNGETIHFFDARRKSGHRGVLLRSYGGTRVLRVMPKEPRLLREPVVGAVVQGSGCRRSSERVSDWSLKRKRDSK